MSKSSTSLSQADQLPACLTRDNLTSPYFPNTSATTLRVVIALCTIFALTSFNRLNHTDLWGHLNFGRWIAEHGALPTADPFAAHSSAAAQSGGQPMLHAAWLSQLAGYHVQRIFGNEGLVFGHALLVTLAAGVLMLAVVRRGAPQGWAWVAGAAMFVLDLPIHGTARPQLFGQLGAALFLLAAAELPTRRQPLVWLPVVAALWANLHGSVLVGLTILGASAIGVTWNVLAELRRTGKVASDARLARVWLPVALAVLGACLGPHGPLLLVRTVFFGEHAALASITEWQPTAFSSLTGLLLLGSLAATIALVKVSPRKWELSEVVMLALFALAAFSALRMLAWWALVWTWVAIPHAAAAWQAYRERNGRAESAPDEATSMRTVLAMGVVFATILIAPPSFALVSGRARGDGPILVGETPLYLAEEVTRRGLQGNLAAPMDWADYLIWKTDGRIKPLVYSHVHLTDSGTWKDYELIFSGHTLWLELLSRHQMHYVVVSRQRHPELAKLVALESRSQAPRLRIVYQDQRCLLAELNPPRQPPDGATGGR